MGRISIDVTDAQRRKLEALAALRGQSVKDFVLSRTIGDPTNDVELAQLEKLLDERIDRARAKGTSGRTVGDVFGQARRDSSRGSDA